LRRFQSKDRLAVVAFPRVPSNEATSILNDFIQKLQVKDPRYDLCWAYGGLLSEIPRRLGTNAALDASVAAMMAAISDLGNPRKSPVTFTRYGYALRCLKSCLDDPIAVQSSSTLCAIYLIWISQVWVPWFFK
jgi:hypothetical protein